MWHSEVKLSILYRAAGSSSDNGGEDAVRGASSNNNEREDASLEEDAVQGSSLEETSPRYPSRPDTVPPARSLKTYPDTHSLLGSDDSDKVERINNPDLTYYGVHVWYSTGNHILVEIVTSDIEHKRALYTEILEEYQTVLWKETPHTLYTRINEAGEEEPHYLEFHQHINSCKIILKRYGYVIDPEKTHYNDKTNEHYHLFRKK